MRLVAASLGLAVLPACSIPNPAYFATQGDSDGSSSVGTTTASTGPGPTTTHGTTLDPGTTVEPVTTTATASTSVTSSTTEPVDPSTTASMTATSTTLTTDSTSGPDSTSTSDGTSDSTGQPMIDLGVIDTCPLLVAPDLALSVQHSPNPQSCTMPESGQAFYGVYEGKTDADSLKFRQCKVFADCVNGNVNCVQDQTVNVNLAGPATHVPVFDVGECVHIAYVGTGYQNQSTCNAKIIRLSRTGPNIPPTSVYVGAVAVPNTAGLPWPWPEFLEFSVAPTEHVPCDQPGLQVCGQNAGGYTLLGTFSNVQTKVPIKSEKAVTLQLYDLQNVDIGDIPGTLYNLRSWAHPVEDCEFKWIWLAADNKPG